MTDHERVEHRYPTLTIFWLRGSPHIHLNRPGASTDVFRAACCAC